MEIEMKIRNKGYCYEETEQISEQVSLYSFWGGESFEIDFGYVTASLDKDGFNALCEMIDNYRDRKEKNNDNCSDKN